MATFDPIAAGGKLITASSPTGVGGFDPVAAGGVLSHSQQAPTTDMPPGSGDPHYVDSVDPATGRPAKAINWANAPTWVPGKYIGEALGGLWDKYAPSFMTGLDKGAKNLVTLPTGEQVAGDVLRSAAIPASIAAAPVSVPGMIATGAGLGAAQAGGQAMTEQKSAQDVTKEAGKGAAIGGITAGIMGALGKGVEAFGEKIQTSVIKPTRADIEDGFKIETLNKYDLGGSLNASMQKTTAKITDLSKQLVAKLEGSDQEINLTGIVNQTAEDLSSSKGMLEGFGQNDKIQSALEQLQTEVKRIDELRSAAGRGGATVSIPDAQVVKRAAGGFGAWKYGIADSDSIAKERVYTAFYRNMKTAIENALPEGEVKAINEQLSELIPIQNAILRRIPVAERNGAISLGDMIGLVAATAHPAALGPVAVNVASKSGWAGMAFAKLGAGVAARAPALGVGAESLFATGPTDSPSQDQLQYTRPPGQ